MFRRLLASRHFLAALAALVIGASLGYCRPFPENALFLRVVALGAPDALASFRWLYNAALFTTPYFLCLGALSALYVATLRYGSRVSPGHLPPYPDPESRSELFLVVGEVHNPRRRVPSETPHWLIIPERGLFTGTMVFGAVGSGKTAAAIYPFTEQILAYR